MGFKSTVGKHYNGSSKEGEEEGDHKSKGKINIPANLIVIDGWITFWRRFLFAVNFKGLFGIVRSPHIKNYRKLYIN